MTCLKSFVVIATLAIAIGQPVTVSASSRAVERVCKDMYDAMMGLTEVYRNAQKAFDFATNYLEQNAGSFSIERKLIKALQAAYKAEECSESSWQHVLLLSRCDYAISALEKPIKTYAARCLSPEYVSKKVRSKTSSLFAPKVDFISATFIETYRRDNPNEGHLHVNYELAPHRRPLEFMEYARRDEFCCDPGSSKTALIQAIDSDMAKKKKDGKKEFYADKTKLEAYLKKKLFDPCTSYVKEFRQFRDEIVSVSRNFMGGQIALLDSLDQGAQNSLFRFKYCEQLESSIQLVTLMAAKHYVQ